MQHQTLLKQALPGQPTHAVHGDAFWTGPLCLSDSSLFHSLEIDALAFFIFLRELYS
jgi:hypothetical protein